MKKRILSFLMVAACAIFMGTSVFAGDLTQVGYSTEYPLDDIYIQAETVDTNTALVSFVNLSPETLTIGPDSMLYGCDMDGTVLYEIDTFAKEYVEVASGTMWSYQTSQLPDNTPIRIRIVAYDTSGDYVAFDSVIGFF